MLELIIPILLGTLAGTITGLIPGIHINLIATLLISLPLIQTTASILPIIFIISMAITHTFLDFIPAIFLGAPDEDTGLGTLPGHEFLLEGKGHEALKLTLIGSVIAIISLIAIIPIFTIIMPKIYPFLQQMMGFSLIWIAIFLIYSEKNSKIKAIFIFTLAGFLGISSLNSGISNPLLPLLTGLFGTSTILNSIQSKTIIPKQTLEKLSLSKKELIKPTLATFFISPICSFFPGLGSSQAAIISSEILRKITRSQFLILLGSINTLVMSISFITLLLFQKSRTGAAFAISQLPTTSISYLTITSTILLSSFLAIPISLKISKTISKNIHKISYLKISKIILLFLIIIITYFSGTIGFLILTTSTSLGLLCIQLQIRRSFLMGSILIPTILFYLPF
ncbi:hypothetical protein HNV12_04290 [Methanococcoides sp. SA1]|nr:hypothetical protein [Methanococcoides sp. SA1]